MLNRFIPKGRKTHSLREEKLGRVIIQEDKKVEKTKKPRKKK